MPEIKDVEIRRYVWHIITATHKYLGRNNTQENRIPMLQAILEVRRWWGGCKVPHTSVGIGKTLTLRIDTTRLVTLPGRSRGVAPLIKRTRSRFEFVTIKSNDGVLKGT
jgi:hypothetical protein